MGITLSDWFNFKIDDEIEPFGKSDLELLDLKRHLDKIQGVLERESMYYSKS